MRRKLSLFLGALVLSGASACSSSSDSLAGMTPASILRSALTAAVKFREVHYVLQTTSNGETQTVTGDAGTSDGAQSVILGSDQTIVEKVGTAAFLRGNAGGLQDIIGFPAARASHDAGRWISFEPGDSLYGTVVQGVTLSSLLSQLRPEPPLIKSSPGTVAGQQVVGVRGGLRTSPNEGEATFWVATAAPNVPVGVDAQSTNSSTGKTVTEVGVFSKWGAQSRVQEPSGAVPLSSLAAQ